MRAHHTCPRWGWELKKQTYGDVVLEAFGPKGAKLLQTSIIIHVLGGRQAEALPCSHHSSSACWDVLLLGYLQACKPVELSRCLLPTEPARIAG